MPPTNRTPNAIKKDARPTPSAIHNNHNIKKPRSQNNTYFISNLIKLARRYRVFIWIIIGTIALSYFTKSDPVPIKQNPPKPNPVPVPPLHLGQWHLLKKLPHDPKAFTQGLAYNPLTQTLYESTGLNSHSSLRKISLETGEVTQIEHVGEKYFGEGITVLENGDVLMLTYTTKVGFIYDGDTLKHKSDFVFETYTGEGWGVASVPAASGDSEEQEQLIVSDGSAKLTTMTLTPTHLKKVKRRTIRFPNGQEAHGLNELEYHDNTILSNIIFSNKIIRIDPSTSTVVTSYDFTELYQEFESDKQRLDVFNGVAYLGDGVFVVTGKFWEWFYFVRLLD